MLESNLRSRAALDPVLSGPGLAFLPATGLCSAALSDQWPSRRCAPGGGGGDTDDGFGDWDDSLDGQWWCEGRIRFLRECCGLNSRYPPRNRISKQGGEAGRNGDAVWAMCVTAVG